MGAKHLMGCHFVAYIPATEKKDLLTRKCVLCCKNKDDGGNAVGKKLRFWCAKCKEPLCVTPCFQNFWATSHSTMNSAALHSVIVHRSKKLLGILWKFRVCFISIFNHIPVKIDIVQSFYQPSMKFTFRNLSTWSMCQEKSYLFWVKKFKWTIFIFSWKKLLSFYFYPHK